MPNPTSTPKQPDKAASPHAGWLTRAQVAAELGYRSIFPIRKMEGGELHPVRDPRGWLFDPVEVAALKAKRPIGNAGGPVSEGRVAARVFYLFDKGRELREIVEELEIAPGVVRDLWHEWLMTSTRARRIAARARRRNESAARRKPNSASWNAGTSRSSRTSRRSWRRWRGPPVAVTIDDFRFHVACSPFQLGWCVPGRVPHVLIGSGLADETSDRRTQPEEDATEPVSQPHVETAILERPPSTVLNGSHGAVAFGFERSEAPARIHHVVSTFAIDDERDSAWQTLQGYCDRHVRGRPRSRADLIAPCLARHRFRRAPRDVGTSEEHRSQWQGGPPNRAHGRSSKHEPRQPCPTEWRGLLRAAAPFRRHSRRLPASVATDRLLLRKCVTAGRANGPPVRSWTHAPDLRCRPSSARVAAAPRALAATADLGRPESGHRLPADGDIHLPSPSIRRLRESASDLRFSARARPSHRDLRGRISRWNHLRVRSRDRGTGSGRSDVSRGQRQSRHPRTPDSSRYRHVSAALVACGMAVSPLDPAAGPWPGHGIGLIE